MKHWFGIFGIMAATTALNSVQAAPTDRYIEPGCLKTPSVSTSNYPGYSSVVPTNKLALPPGKSIPALGQKVYLFARVFDRNCVPLSEAKIDFWHANPEGDYRFATPAALATPDAIFTGAGRATSDNLGQFQFYTLYPGPYSYTVRNDDGSRYTIKRAPHFNLRISHPDMRAFNTNLFFDGDYRNETDHRYKRLSAADKPRVLMRVEPRSGDFNQGVQAFVDIILPEAAPFRKY